MAYLYILECSDGSYYSGSTWGLEQRMAEHLAGLGCDYTKERLPVKLVYWEEHERIEDAFRREKQIELVLGNVAGIRGALEAYAGKALPPMEGMRLEGIGEE